MTELRDVYLLPIGIAVSEQPLKFRAGCSTAPRVIVILFKPRIEGGINHESR
jgi:hypothetical protein